MCCSFPFSFSAATIHLTVARVHEWEVHSGSISLTFTLQEPAFESWDLNDQAKCLTLLSALAGVNDEGAWQSILAERDLLDDADTFVTVLGAVATFNVPYSVDYRLRHNNASMEWTTLSINPLITGLTDLSIDPLLASGGDMTGFIEVINNRKSCEF
jgi:hypothetical protein